MIRFILVLIMCCFTQFSYAGSYMSSVKHEIYFEGSDYELNIYKVKGRNPGKTMLIIGGIQGDEPGGFLSADMYTELHLEKGNLIVVPRANFKSIILFDRGPDGDMNRRFADNKRFLEMDKVVGILKQLMAESDIFLHLHDGWGYHNAKYINKNRNPKRFGQSVIVDDEEYQCTDGSFLNLKEMALAALEEANSKIKHEKYKMQFFNTDTSNNLTNYPAMKKTATYYAVRENCIPAFGIEASKNLPTLEMKILHHNYVVNAFMSMMDIIPEQPKVLLEKPVLNSVNIIANGSENLVKNNSTIYVQKNSFLTVENIIANYTRGLSCDIKLSRGVNDYRKPVKISKDTEIIIRKDNIIIGKVMVKVSTKHMNADWVFVMEVDGIKKILMADQTIEIKRGSILRLIKTFGESDYTVNTIMNFKGFVPPHISNNTGDDRGYAILIDGKFMSKYSKSGKGNLFPVIAGETKSERARFWVQIID